eukprot:350029-Chlamydomonas_euryale.AAC.2
MHQHTRVGRGLRRAVLAQPQRRWPKCLRAAVFAAAAAVTAVSIGPLHARGLDVDVECAQGRVQGHRFAASCTLWDLRSFAFRKVRGIVGRGVEEIGLRDVQGWAPGHSI